MATIDENGEIRDGRNRKVNFTLCVQPNDRLIINCSKCGDDFNDISSSQRHYEEHHSHESKSSKVIGSSEPVISEMGPNISKEKAKPDDTAPAESSTSKTPQRRAQIKKTLQQQSKNSIEKPISRRSGRSAAKTCAEKLQLMTPRKNKMRKTC